MRFGGFMTPPALHSRSHFVHRELPPESRIRRVTPEASQLIVAAHQAPRRVDDVCRRRTFGAQSRCETIQLAEITHAALIELAVFFKDISLADRGTCSHRPPDWHGHRLGAIRNRVAALAALSLDPVRVSAHFGSQYGMIDENSALLNRFERVRHGSSRLKPRLYVTGCARGNTARVCLCPSGCGKNQAQKLPLPSHYGLETATSFWPLSRRNSSRSLAASAFRPALA